MAVTKYVGDIEKIAILEETNSYGVWDDPTSHADAHALSGITSADPGVFTFNSGSDECSDGDVVQITNVSGMKEVNQMIGVVKTATATGDFKLKALGTDNYLDTTNFTTYTSGGYALTWSDIRADVSSGAEVESWAVWDTVSIDIDPGTEGIKGVNGSIKIDQIVDKLSKFTGTLSGRIVDSRILKLITSDTMSTTTGNIDTLTPTLNLPSYTMLFQIENGKFLAIKGIKFQGSISCAKDGFGKFEADYKAQEAFICDGTISNTTPSADPYRWFDSSTMTIQGAGDTADICVTDWKIGINRDITPSRGIQSIPDFDRKRIITHMIEKKLDMTVDLTIEVKDGSLADGMFRAIGNETNPNFVTDDRDNVEIVIKYTAGTDRVIKATLSNAREVKATYEGKEDIDIRTWKVSLLSPTVSFAGSKFS